MKNLAQATRDKLESLPRTNQSLGRPQDHALPSDRSLRNVYESEESSARSQAGPAIADLKPSYQPKPSYKPASKPKPSAIAKSTSKPKAKSPSKSKRSGQLATAASSIAKKVGVSDSVSKKIITEATPAADVAAKTLKENSKAGTGKLGTMKIAPRTLIASLEKYIPLEAEQLIGAGGEIDLDAADLEPLTMQVKAVTKSTIAKTQKVIARNDLNPADMPAIDPAEAVALDPGAEIPAKVAEASSPAGSRTQVQPMGMSFFERFALSTMVASENHLATIPVVKEGPPTKNVSTVATDDDYEIKPPVIMADPEAVKFQSNDIPPSHVSPGLDEMVISSTSQTDFDLNDSEMAFIGNVQVKSPRFNLRSDKFIVHLKKDNSGMAYGEAIGNVVIEMRENGRPTGYSGLASNAVYHPEDGKITLSGWPKIRQEFKEHVATTRDTKMVLYTDGRVKTIGRNRTIIRK